MRKSRLSGTKQARMMEHFVAATTVKVIDLGVRRRPANNVNKGQFPSPDVKLHQHQSTGSSLGQTGSYFF